MRLGAFIVPDDVLAAYIELYESWSKPEQVQQYRQLQREVLAQPLRPRF